MPTCHAHRIEYHNPPCAVCVLEERVENLENASTHEKASKAAEVPLKIYAPKAANFPTASSTSVPKKGK